MASATKTHQSRRFMAGFSLVELMVASVIALITTIAIFQVFAVFEGQRRTTTSGGDAQTNGALALYTLERDVRMAGYGFNQGDILGCVIQGWYDPADGNPGTNFNLSAIPVQITQGVGGAPDAITIGFANSDALVKGIPLQAAKTAAATEYNVVTRTGFTLGDKIVAVKNVAGAVTCAMSEVTGLPTTAGSTTIIETNTGEYVVDAGTNKKNTAHFNKAGGNGIDFPNQSLIFTFGNPASNSYSLSDGQFVLTSNAGLALPSSAAMFDGLVQLQAQYGIDTNNDKVVDAYVDTFVPPATPRDWSQVIAVRIALVARASQWEKDQISDASIVLWPASLVAPTTTGVTWNLTADERHYRYKVYQVVVPLRNMIWRDD